MMTWTEEMFLNADTLLTQGEISEGKKLLETILADEPDFGKAHNHLGWIYYTQLNDYNKGLFHLELAVKFDPTYQAGYLNGAYVLNHLNLAERLIALVDKALVVNGINKTILYTELAKSYEINGNYKMAIANYKYAIMHSLNNDEITDLEKDIASAKKKIRLFGKWYLFF
jgi:tetratricopeptide (TPR) repeat protein